MTLDSIQGRAWHAELDDARRASGQGMTVEAVEVRIGSESGQKIATLDIKANDLVKHVKEQLETKTGIDHAVMRLSRRFHSGRVDQLWQLRNNGRVSSYRIKDGSILVLRCVVRGVITSDFVTDHRFLCRHWKKRMRDLWNKTVETLVKARRDRLRSRPTRRVIGKQKA